LKKKEQLEVEPEKPSETPVEFLASLAGVLVTGLFIITFIFQAFEIPSSSMVKTLLIGDHVFADRIQFSPKTNWVQPIVKYDAIKRGDIVVFLSMDPRTPDMYIVKRIIGLPGDRIHLRDGQVYRNGEKLNEPYAIHTDPNAYGREYRDNFPAVPADENSGALDEWKLTMGSHIEGEDIVVPPNSYFGMGDNRDVSLDSRYWGFISSEHVIGRPMFIYWSFDTPEDQFAQREVGQRVGNFIHTVLHFFDETRWNRTFKGVR
jgi:signal peptidase I